MATLAGYGFGRFRFRFSGLAFGLILLALMIPFQAVLTPLFARAGLVMLGLVPIDVLADGLARRR